MNPNDKTEYWRKKAYYEAYCRATWRSWFFVACAGIFCAAIGGYALGSSRAANSAAAPIAPIAPAACAPAAEMPDETLATFILYNAACQLFDAPCYCSGAFISKGPKYGLGLTAGHCFKGNVGGKFWVFRPDGKRTVGTLIAIEPAQYGTQGDLALIRVPTEDVLATAPLWEGDVAPKSIDVIGYPGGEGPAHLSLGGASISYCGQWLFPVKNGAIIPGNSGSAVFADGRVCGVIAGWGESQRQARTGSGFEHLAGFLLKNRKKLKGCRDGRCKLPAEEEGDDDAIPPLKGHEGKLPPFGAPDWKPKPQSPLPTLYDGHGRPPQGLRTPHQRSKAISDLQHQELQQQIEDLTAVVKDIQSQSPVAGPPGKTGPAGPPGSAADVSALQKQIDALAGKIASSGIDADAVQSMIDASLKRISSLTPQIDQASLRTAVDLAVSNALLKQPQARGEAGPRGPTGPTGPAGVVTVRLIDGTTGQTIREIPNVESGSVVPLKKTVSVSTAK